MKLLSRLALLFVIVPIIELVLLIQVGQVIGLLPTLALVLITGVTGAWLARAEGLRAFLRFQRELASGRLPGESLLDGIAVLVGGAFLLTPGVLTDLVGFSLLLPTSRRWIQRSVRGRLEKQIRDGTVRVVTGQGGAGVGGMAGWTTWGGGSADTSEGDVYSDPRMDPSKGIVIEEPAEPRQDSV